MSITDPAVAGLLNSPLLAPRHLNLVIESPLNNQLLFFVVEVGMHHLSLLRSVDILQLHLLVEGRLVLQG